MKLLDDLLNLKREISKSSIYIRSEASKNLISDFYKTDWLPISEKFNVNFGTDIHDKVESEFTKLYDLSKKDYFLKSSALQILQSLVEILDGLHVEMIRKGSVIETDTKKEIIDSLTKSGFSNTLTFIQNAEKEFSQKKSKETCQQVRLSIEEFFRKIREMISGTPITRGSLGVHLDHLENLNKISFAERQLIQKGFYAFLSEKGDHATSDVPDESDAKISLYIFYIIVEYVLEKPNFSNLFI
jgi:hypothetical protein